MARESPAAWELALPVRLSPGDRPPRIMRDIRKAEAAVEAGEVMTADELRRKYLKR